MSFIRFSTGIKNVVPLLTLANHGRISFNKIATEHFGLESFKYVILFYHEKQKMIKIEWTNNQNELGILPLLQSKVGSSISGKRFLDYFDIRPNIRDSYRIKASKNNSVIVNLNHPYEKKWAKIKRNADPENKLKLKASFPGYQRFTNPSRCLTPMMTLTSYGRMTFNTSCRGRYRITSYKYCILLYDNVEKIIKIRLTNNVKEDGAIPLENNILASHIAGKSFLKYFDILPARSMSYLLYYSKGDELIVDLKKLHVKTRRIRTPKIKSQD